MKRASDFQMPFLFGLHMASIHRCRRFPSGTHALCHPPSSHLLFKTFGGRQTLPSLSHVIQRFLCRAFSSQSPTHLLVPRQQRRLVAVRGQGRVVPRSAPREGHLAVLAARPFSDDEVAVFPQENLRRRFRHFVRRDMPTSNAVSARVETRV